jgi:hypothetical protein
MVPEEGVERRTGVENKQLVYFQWSYNQSISPIQPMWARFGHHQDEDPLINRAGQRPHRLQCFLYGGFR